MRIYLARTNSTLEAKNQSTVGQRTETTVDKRSPASGVPLRSQYKLIAGVLCVCYVTVSAAG